MNMQYDFYIFKSNFFILSLTKTILKPIKEIKLAINNTVFTDNTSRRIPPHKSAKIPANVIAIVIRLVPLIDLHFGYYLVHNRPMLE